MSAKPAALNLALQRFVDEQYAITVRDQHLLVHDVPYVAADRTVKRGTLACTFITNADVAQPPDSHQAWFSGEFPCYPDGKEIVALGLDKQVRELFPGFVTNAWFSNKPPNGFADHYTKMTHYIRVISDQARAVEAEVDARTGKDPVIYANDPVFRYPDSASARGEYLATSERLRLKKLAIIGLGGTGGYVLDQVAKTPVTEVHLFDGDEFLEHNAFRAPGAARASLLRVAGDPPRELFENRPPWQASRPRSEPPT